MDDATLWWLVAASLVVVELLTGSLYLLMLAAGAAAGAVAAHIGAGLPAQLALAAGVGGVAVVLWRMHTLRRKAQDPADALHLDIGERVWVAAWDAQGRATVKHRGAHWVAMCASNAAAAPAPAPGWHRIESIEGPRLVLSAA